MPAKRANVRLTKERLREVLRYDSETGIFTWIRSWKGIFAGSVAGVITNMGYWSIGIDHERFLAHHLAWFYIHGEWPKCQIDHINGNPLDNRIANLRLSTQAQNVRNKSRHKNNKSGYKGVSFHKGTGRWAAWIMAEGKRYYLGLFDTPEEAHAAYCEAAIRLHGEFARFA